MVESLGFFLPRRRNDERGYYSTRVVSLQFIGAGLFGEKMSARLQDEQKTQSILEHVAS